MKLAVLGLIIVLGCAANTQNKVPNLIGSWALQDKDVINYPEIIFNEDSTAIFKSKGDTIYRFTYLLDGSNLVLQDVTGNKESYEILHLNKDSLIFKDLRENKEQQIYVKK
jgi:hypothetical protein